MSAHAQFEYPPPRSWEQFEELCADTFAAEWTDPALVRHGRAGQRQHGVDIVARHGARWPIGLQCKKKSKWPVKRLTTQEIDQEVMKARKFRAKLQSFYILTTAPDDTAIQKHVREINEKHASSGLFNVEVLGWSEIVRRATLHAAVARKHFGGSSNEPPSPLLAVLFASQHLLELKGVDLSLTCRESTTQLSRNRRGPHKWQLLSASFMDYAMPRARKLPTFITALSEVPAPGNPLGVRAGGEGGTTPALAVVINAIVDALSEFGVPHVEMPATSERVWRAIQDAQTKQRGMS